MKFIVLLVAIVACLAYDGFDPVANPEAIVEFGNARFTVLTPYVIRVEYSKYDTPVFHDEPSFAIINRNVPVPKYSKTITENILDIETEYLHLVYDKNGVVTDPKSLKITLKFDQKTEWTYGLKNPGRFDGTIRTLDGVNGRTGMDCIRESWDSDNFCEKGVISRDGWAIIVDGPRPRFTDDEDWMWTEGPLADGLGEDPKYIDFYFFGHGFNYKQALKDFVTIGGSIPYVPKYSLGTWYSRYHAYTDADMHEIIGENFANTGFPIDMMVIDMDFHKSYSRGFPNPYNISVNGWSGFTWYNEVFPSPSNLMNFMKKRNVYTTLNTHPAGGIQFYEEFYKEMAESMGIDPSSGKTVEWNITDKTYAKNLFNIILQPFHDRGMEFWWIDYQQDESTTYKNVNPTIWTDYTWFTTKTRWSNGDRPFIMGRFGGLGTHRYPIGFSGDTFASWKSLDFQVEFNSLAANVAYQWGHDLGGHQSSMDTAAEELNTRWIEFGAFTQSMRTHNTRDRYPENAHFARDFRHMKILKRYYRLRERFVPYVYKSSIETHNTGLSYTHGLYYEEPLVDAAYTHPNIYMFGSDLVVAPVTQPAWDADTELAIKDIYLPNGNWYDLQTGLPNKGGVEYSMNFTLSEVPVYAREGSIIPMMQLDNNNLEGAASRSPKTMLFYVYPGAVGNNYNTVYYDDQGKDISIENGEFYSTKVDYKYIDSTHIKIVINPVEGKGYKNSVENRNYEFRLFNVYPASEVSINGEKFEYSVYGRPDEFGENGKWFGNEYSYDGKTFSLWIHSESEYDIHKSVEIIISLQAEHDSHLNYPLYRMISRTKSCKESILLTWGETFFEDYPNMMYLSTISTRIEESNDANTIKNLIDKIYSDIYPIAIEEMYNLTTSNKLKTVCINLVHDGINVPPQN